jgi:hypothetical protein
MKKYPIMRRLSIMKRKICLSIIRNTLMKIKKTLERGNKMRKEKVLKSKKKSNSRNNKKLRQINNAS